MKYGRIAAAVTGFVIAVSGVVLATTGIGETEAPPHPAASTGTHTYREPSDQRLADGAYLGYIRALSIHESTVAVDFVSLEEGVLANARPEQRVDAGVLGRVSFFETVPLPFRIRLHDGVIVSVQSAGDLVEAAHVLSPASGRIEGHRSELQTAEELGVEGDDDGRQAHQHGADGG